MRLAATVPWLCGVPACRTFLELLERFSGRFQQDLSSSGSIEHSSELWGNYGGGMADQAGGGEIGGDGGRREQAGLRLLGGVAEEVGV